MFILSPYALFGQNDYGFRHLQTIYKGDTVDILVKSKKGEEQKKKPLFFFCQGSQPIPLIITYDQNGRQGIYSVFPFNPDSLSNEYHLAIISKPYVPLIVNQKSLSDDLTYKDNTGQYPRKYIERNLLDYYVKRDKSVIRFLRKQNWISKDKLVIAGHSEGSAIAAKLALTSNSVTALIYSGASPMGRIMTIIERSRAKETDSTREAEADINYWEKIVADPGNMDGGDRDAYGTTYQFSIPLIRYVEKLKIPVLVTYGSKDASAPFNDYLRVETIRQKKKNFTFKAYIGTEHNFFPLKPDGTVNYDIFNWDKVAGDWRTWLTGK
ncbi:BAAT / Acyl-CoA thioester hydrolase C terminal [Chitinophaga sp. CF118]|nr:BAAT / Acyl-CoA thioester hydrolase C terminal [Chitinophaga sp. CF118]